MFASKIMYPEKPEIDITQSSKENFYKIGKVCLSLEQTRVAFKGFGGT